MRLELNGVGHAFSVPGHPAGYPSVRDLTLSAAAGEITVLFGGSGCGKSTVLNLIAGLLVPDTGTIGLLPPCGTVMGGRVGFVFQTPTLIPWLSVKENALFSALVCAESPVHTHEEVERLLDQFGIADKKDAFPRALSGGMQQRVALIRAILSDALVLLLDEPFSNSDLVMRRALHSELRQAVEERGLIAVLVTHDVADAALLGDQIYVLTPRPASVAFAIRNPVSREERQAESAGMRKQLAELEHLIARELYKSINDR